MLQSVILNTEAESELSDSLIHSINTYQEPSVCPQAWAGLEIHWWAKLMEFMVWEGRHTLTKLSHKYTINCSLSAPDGLAGNWANVESQRGPTPGRVFWTELQRGLLAERGVSGTSPCYLCKDLKCGASVRYLRNWKACGWNKGHERIKRPPEWEAEHRKMTLSTPVQSSAKGASFYPDTGCMGVAHYLATASSSSHHGEGWPRFFSAWSCPFLLFYYFKQNTVFHCKTRAMSFKETHNLKSQ